MIRASTPFEGGVPGGSELHAAIAEAAARPAVRSVMERYLQQEQQERRHEVGDEFPSVGQSSLFLIYRVVRAGLQTGLRTGDVAAGVMQGILRRARADSGRPLADEQIRGAAGAVMAAMLCYGGRVREAIDGILSSTIDVAGNDSSAAVAAAAAGIMDGLGDDSFAG